MHFFIPVAPVPKARPRVTRRGITFTPKTTKQAMQEIKNDITAVYRQEPLEGPLSVYLTFYIPIPKSYSKKRRDELLGNPCIRGRGDIDNYAKLVMDALNQVLWKDDSQIWKLCCTKVWSNTPKIEMFVQPMNEYEYEMDTFESKSNYWKD